MFKVGLELPTKVAEEASSKKKKKATDSIDAHAIESMMSELKNAAPENVAARAEKTAEEKAARKAAKNARRIAEKQQKQLDNTSIAQKKTEKVEQVAPLKESAREDITKRHAEEPAPASQSSSKMKKLTPMQLKMQQKLSGSRFRWINEQLYTTKSDEAFHIFQTQPQVFKEYHDGFRHQVESWPENPVNSLVAQFQERLQKPVNAPGGLPGDKQQGSPAQLVVADMGCGEAELALQLGKMKSPRGVFKVHSFDMHKANDRITVADIANVPLENESVHIVTYCLALMGTNLLDFITEGIRILKPNGLVWIAEIRSRFDNGDYSKFVESLKQMGLYHKTTDDSNKMFVKFEFIKLPHKMAKAKNHTPDIYLKPCIYKRR